jgi:hypothetical protein
MRDEKEEQFVGLGTDYLAKSHASPPAANIGILPRLRLLVLSAPDRSHPASIIVPFAL